MPNVWMESVAVPQSNALLNPYFFVTIQVSQDTDPEDGRRTSPSFNSGTLEKNCTEDVTFEHQPKILKISGKMIFPYFVVTSIHKSKRNESRAMPTENKT